MNKIPVTHISPKPFADYTAEEYHTYVSDMFGLPKKKGSAKPTAGVPGLTVSRTRTGTLSLRKTKARSFTYVTMAEVKKLADFAKASQADVWNLFKKKEYIIAKDKMEAEQIYSRIKEIPWGQES